MHDVGLVAVDEELEAVADDEDEDDAHEHGRHVHVPPLARRHRRQHLTRCKELVYKKGTIWMQTVIHWLSDNVHKTSVLEPTISTNGAKDDD